MFLLYGSYYTAFYAPQSSYSDSSFLLGSLLAAKAKSSEISFSCSGDSELPSSFSATLFISISKVSDGMRLKDRHKDVNSSKVGVPCLLFSRSITRLNLMPDISANFLYGIFDLSSEKKSATSLSSGDHVRDVIGINIAYHC